MINSIDYYKKYVCGSNNCSSEIKELSDRYSEQYNNSISKFDILINSDRADTIYINDTEYKCIVDYGNEFNKTDFKDEFMREVWISQGILKSGMELKYQERVTKEKNDYMVLADTIEVSGSYIKTYMTKSNYKLKWLNKWNKIIEQNVYSKNTTMYSIGKRETEYLTIEDGKLQIMLSYNTETDKLNRGQTFFYHKKVYEITFEDFSKVTNNNGYIGLTLKEKQATSSDNFEIGITNYHNRPQYTLKINEEDISMSKYENPRQLTTNLLKDNQTYTDNDYTLIWESDSPSIATIDTNGNIQPLSVGKCNIKCYLKENPDIYVYIEVDIVDEIINQVDMYVIGDDKLEWQWECEYEAVKLVNGIKQNIQWNYSIDYMGNKTDIVKEFSVINNKAKIVANEKWIKGTIKLIATNGLDKVEKQIKIVGWGE